MRYFSKNNMFEKQAIILPSIVRGVAFAGRLSGSSNVLPKFIGSDTFKFLAKNIGTKRTIETLQASTMPEIKSNIANITSTLSKNIGPERLTNVYNTLDPTTKGYFSTSFTGPTLQKALTGESKIKGMWDYLKYQVGIGDTPLRNIIGSIKSNKYFAGKNPGEVYLRSRIGKPTSKILERGLDIYFLGDAVFGELEPGQTRTGKLLGTTGLLGGYRSTRRFTTGLARGTLYGAIGSKIGNRFGNPVPQNEQFYKYY